MLKVNTQILPGAIGNIEAVWNEMQIEVQDTAALVCHPHPLFDGTMHNKVVSTLVKTFGEIGIPSLKFNFRGVGESQGTYAAGDGETDDAEAMLQWLREEQGIKRLYLAGFSFGSYVTAKLAQRLLNDSSIEIQHVVLVAPPVQNFDFTPLYPSEHQTTVLVCDADEVVPPEEVYHWLDSVYPPLDRLEFEGASHFFHGRLTELKTRLKEALTA